MSRCDNLKQFLCEAKEIASRARSLRQPSNRIQIDRNSTERSSLRLAHYTSLEAIVSMLQNSGGGLRLYDSSKMNDPEEGRATTDGRTISRYLKGEFGKDSWLWKRYSLAHICCFVGISGKENQTVDAGDDLLFWRLYGNECRGVSITIAPHKSKELIESSAVQRVIYTNEPPMQVDLRLISKLFNDLDNLRSRACKVGYWSKIYKNVLPECDLLLGQRFLQKRSHYEMEREYRAVNFVTQDDAKASEDSQFPSHGRHVQYGLIRTYVQIPALSCESILTTGSQITIGANVPKSKNAKNTLDRLLEPIGGAPNVISARVSEIRYRPR